jgi:hypothetical protein
VNLDEHIKQEIRPTQTKKAKFKKVDRAPTSVETSDGYSLLSNIVGTFKNHSPMDARSSKRVKSNKESVDCKSMLSQLYFKKRRELDAEGETKRIRKGGSTTWEERRDIFNLGTNSRR